MTITDLLDKQKMIAWLAHDGNPPTVKVQGPPPRRQYGMGWRPGETTIKPVADDETLDIWWTQYRAALAVDWQKSPENPHKPQTWTQFIASCLSAIGIKGGKVQDRVKRAVATFPELYQAV